MLGEAMYTTIRTLIERGLNITQISKTTGHDWKTVQKVIKRIQTGQEAPIKKPHPSMLDSYKDKIIQLLEQGLSALRIHEEITSLGCAAKYPTVRGYVGEIKKKQNIFIRIHTSPGEEAQVDFGYAGITKDNAGKHRKTWVFNMRLSYSRMDYYQKVYDQRIETFIECHINAFKYFGGVPEYVKIDNLKAAILEANFYEPVYQRTYAEFAKHYNFKSLPCRIYQPNDKGKVESGVKYVKINFFKGREFKNSDDLDHKLSFWMNHTCNVRIHGTTKKVPRELFESDEKRMLKPLPESGFIPSKLGTRKVYHDCHIYVDHNYYSVPYKYVGKVVEIELKDSILKVYYQGAQVALHTRQSGKGGFSTVREHYPPYKRISKTEYQEVYRLKMADIGKHAEELFGIISSEDTKGWSRSVKGILSLLKTYPKDIVEKACQRSLSFGIHRYQVIKNICQNGSYNLPCDYEFTHNSGCSDINQPRIVAYNAN